MAKLSSLPKIFREAVKKGASDFSSQKKNYLVPSQIQPTGGSHQIEGVGTAYWWSPLQPIKPLAPADQRPRQRSILPGENIIWTPGADKLLGFETLRLLADSWDVLRLIIETRKDQLCAKNWDIRVVAEPGEKNSDRKQRQLQDPVINKLKQFFEKPDGVNPFKQWMRMWLEDYLVLDAVAIYLERDKDGKIASAIPLDGSTINRLMTDQGLTPPPPSPAYQQVLYGTPAFDLTTEDLHYSMRNPRTSRRYGYSKVEQIMATIATGIRQQEFLLSYFTAGNMPEALCFLPADLPVDKVKEVQQWFDAVFAGDLQKRRRLTFLPGYGSDNAVKPNIVFPKEPLLKGVAEEWIVQIACYCFSVSAQPFLKMMNRATAEQANETAQEEGMRPDAEYVVDVMNGIIHAMGYSDKYEWAWQDTPPVDPKKAADTDKTLVSAALYTINEIRERRGEDPVADPEADMLGTFTQKGFIPLSADQAAAREKKLPSTKKPITAKPPAKKTGTADAISENKYLTGEIDGPIQETPMGFAAGQVNLGTSATLPRFSYEAITKSSREPWLQKFSNGTTQINLPEGIANTVEKLRELVDEEHLGDKERDAKALLPHITVCYGLLNNNYNVLISALQDIKEFNVTFGKTIAFEPTDGSDGESPIVFEVFSDGRLYEIHEIIQQHIEVKASSFSYCPHSLFAYVKPEYADVYVGMDGLEGVSFTVDRIYIYSKDGKEIAIKLAQKD